MATGGVLGNGVKVAYSAASPVSWLAIGQVLDTKIPTYVRDKVNITTHSTTNDLKRYMSGMIEVGDMELSVLQDLDETTSTDQDALWDDNQTGVPMWWRVEIPTTRARDKFVAFEFQGNVASFEPSTPIEDKQTLRVVIRFDGTTLTKYPAGTSAIS